MVSATTVKMNSFFRFGQIDLLAIQQKSLDRALFLYIFIMEILSSGVRASITVAEMGHR